MKRNSKLNLKKWSTLCIVVSKTIEFDLQHINNLETHFLTAQNVFRGIVITIYCADPSTSCIRFISLLEDFAFFMNVPRMMVKVTFLAILKVAEG